MTAAKTSTLHFASELAEPLGTTPQSVYCAAKNGWLGGIIRVGKHVKIKRAAFVYHLENGYGAGVEPWSPDMENAEAAA